jgi:hypothetical protein
MGAPETDAQASGCLHSQRRISCPAHAHKVDRAGSTGNSLTARRLSGAPERAAADRAVRTARDTLHRQEVRHPETAHPDRRVIARSVHALGCVQPKRASGSTEPITGGCGPTGLDGAYLLPAAPRWQLRDSLFHDDRVGGLVGRERVSRDRSMSPQLLTRGVSLIGRHGMR